MSRNTKNKDHTHLKTIDFGNNIYIQVINNKLYLQVSEEIIPLDAYEIYKICVLLQNYEIEKEEITKIVDLNIDADLTNCHMMGRIEEDMRSDVQPCIYDKGFLLGHDSYLLILMKRNTSEIFLQRKNKHIKITHDKWSPQILTIFVDLITSDLKFAPRDHVLPRDHCEHPGLPTEQEECHHAKSWTSLCHWDSKDVQICSLCGMKFEAWKCYG